MERSSPAAWCERCAASPPSRQIRARRIRRCDDPSPACPWPAAPGRGCWSVLESVENAFRYARSSSVLPANIDVLAGLEYHHLSGLSPARPAPSMPKKAGLLPAFAALLRRRDLPARLGLDHLEMR